MKYKEQDTMGYRTISNARDEVEPERIGYMTAIDILENKYQTYGWELVFLLISDHPEVSFDELLEIMKLDDHEISVVKPYLIGLVSGNLR